MRNNPIPVAASAVFLLCGLSSCASSISQQTKRDFTAGHEESERVYPPVGMVQCGVSKKHGFLIGHQRLVLTIGQFMPAFPRMSSIRSCTYVTRRSDGTIVRSKFRVHYNGLDPDKSMQTDWAILVLDKPVSSKPFHIGTVNQLVKADDTRVVHFRRGVHSHTVLSSSNCMTRRASNFSNAIEFSCPMHDVIKGAPIVVWDNQEWRAGGMVSRSGGKGIGFDYRLLDALEKAIENEKSADRQDRVNMKNESDQE